MPDNSLQITETLEQEVVKPLIKEAEGIQVTTQKEVEQASGFLKDVHEGIKNIEKERKKITSPLNKSLRATNKMFREIKKPLEETKEILKEKILEWQIAERERIEKEEERRRKIQMAHIEKGHNVEEMVQLDRPDKTIANSQLRKVWTFKVTDFSQVPDEYKVIDKKAVKKVLKKDKTTKIPGIEFYQEETLAVV